MVFSLSSYNYRKDLRKALQIIKVVKINRRVVLRVLKVSYFLFLVELEATVITCLPCCVWEVHENTEVQASFFNFLF